MGFQIITEVEHLMSVKKLAYKAYVEELNWKPEPGNPSNFRIVTNPEGNYLDDNFSDRATYFGYYHKNNLIAGGRYILGNFQDLELSLYQSEDSLPKYNGLRIAEINRICIRKEFLQSPVLPILFLEILDYLSKMNLCQKAITTVAFPNPGELFIKLGFNKDSEPFIYGKNDFEPVTVISLDVTNQENLRRISNVIGNLYGTKI